MKQDKIKEETGRMFKMLKYPPEDCSGLKQDKLKEGTGRMFKTLTYPPEDCSGLNDCPPVSREAPGNHLTATFAGHGLWIDLVYTLRKLCLHNNTDMQTKFTDHGY